MNSTRQNTARLPRTAWGILLGLGCVALLLHLVTIHRYGIFRDELYYIACAEHLDWGYVDHPPFVPFLVWLIRTSCGDSLVALRLPSALALSLVVLLTGAMARRLGGGRYAQGFAAAAALISPAFLIMGSFLSVNAFDILWWTLASYVFIRLIERKPSPHRVLVDDGGHVPVTPPLPRGSGSAAPPSARALWLSLGLVFAAGLLTKYTILFLAFGVLLGLLLSRHRRLLLSPWPWLASLLALLLFLPHLAWQVRHDWPTLEFLRNIRLYKNYPVSPLQFLGMQLLAIHPCLAPAWIGGLGWFLFGAERRRDRVLALVFLVVFSTLMLLKAKFYYAFPAYPPLLAGGGVWFERLLCRPHRRLLTWINAAGLPLAGLVTLPYGLPVLSVGAFTRYDSLVHLEKPLRLERDRRREQHPVFADMIGWPELARAVARVFEQRAPEERGRCAIIAANYGQAGAIDYFGRAFALPASCSGHNSYFDWGPPPETCDVVIAVGMEPELLRELFGEVSLVEIVHNEHARESVTEIHLCRTPRIPLSRDWPAFKVYR